jgi:hypothetical protein
LCPFLELNSKPTKKRAEESSKLSETCALPSVNYSVVLLPLYYKQIMTVIVPLPSACFAVLEMNATHIVVFSEV